MEKTTVTDRGYRHDLSNYMDGNWYQTEEGDFSCTVNTFKLVLAYHAKKHGLKVRTTVRGVPEGSVKFQFYGDNE